jgi:hypothetical protein
VFGLSDRKPASNYDIDQRESPNDRSDDDVGFCDPFVDIVGRNEGPPGFDQYLRAVFIVHSVWWRQNRMKGYGTTTCSCRLPSDKDGGTVGGYRAPLTARVEQGPSLLHV